MQMERKFVEEIVDANPNVDDTAIERCDDAARQLADAGIELGGYRLDPALGGTVLDRPILTSLHVPHRSRQQ